jgi:hypothetical protein
MQLQSGSDLVVDEQESQVSNRIFQNLLYNNHPIPKYLLQLKNSVC